ncbi:twin-arginine translocase TatA/TatE family subunit [Actinomycetospora endophytica]|uniref:Twin-arginine translocase TatA/TatE family subunit n=1 Tax=Actinomycetospora endophytica TaxID=2291215 RepID=A0ABS8P8E7_9PSEU|nr:twin-arginine translocase TatA/TatE family subunit [Actinomycetospora endophytica]
MLVVLVVLFGAKKLPDAARGLGQSLRIFKAEMSASRVGAPPTDPAAGSPSDDQDRRPQNAFDDASEVPAPDNTTPTTSPGSDTVQGHDPDPPSRPHPPLERTPLHDQPSTPPG